MSPKIQPPFNNLSAAQLAGGKDKLVQPGDALTKEQKAAVVEAFKQIPLGDLSSDAAAFVQGELKKLETKLGKKLDIDPAKTTLADLGAAGGKIGAALVNHLKKKNPAAYAALVAGGVGVAAGVAYTQGSAGLQKLGIPTDLSKTLKGFDLKLGTRFEPGFEKAKATGGVGRSFGKYGSFGVEATGGGDGFEKGSAKVKVGTDNSVSGGVTANDKGVETVSAGATAKVGPVTIAANGSRNVQTGADSGSASVNLQLNPNTKIAVQGNGSIDGEGKRTGTVSGQVSYGKGPVDVVVKGSAGPDERMIGVGVKVDLDKKKPAKKTSAPEPSVDAEVMRRAVTQGASQVTAEQLRPKGVTAGDSADPAALASAIAERIGKAARSGKVSIELPLPKEYEELGPAERKKITAAIAAIAKAVAAEMPDSGVRSIKINFGKQGEYAALGD